MKSREPNKIGFPEIGELLPAEIDAVEVATPARQFPTDGANCRGVTTANPMFEVLGFRRGRRWRWWTRRLTRRGGDLPRFRALVEVKPLLLLV